MDGNGNIPVYGVPPSGGKAYSSHSTYYFRCFYPFQFRQLKLGLPTSAHPTLTAPPFAGGGTAPQAEAVGSLFTTAFAGDWKKGNATCGLCLYLDEALKSLMRNTHLVRTAALCLLLSTLLGPVACTGPGLHSAGDSPTSEGDGTFTVGPEYKIQADLTDKGNPKGKKFEFTMRLADSKIFRGDDSTLEPLKKAVRKERKIFVYVPAIYKDGTEAPVLIIHDGPGQFNLVRNALDNLTISPDPKRKLPAFIAVAVENGGNDAQNSQRGLEYDTMSDRLARFINDEVLPAVVNNPEIKAAYPRIAITKDPWGRAVLGCSSGGAAALSMAWFRPDLFRRVMAYSGTFVDQQDDDAAEEAKYPLGAWEYHSSMKLIEKSEKKPLRIFTHVSENDNRAKDAESTYHNWVMAGNRTAAALKAKGYHQRYVFSLDSKHCDGRVFEHTLADALVWIWQGYPVR